MPERNGGSRRSLVTHGWRGFWSAIEPGYTHRPLCMGAGPPAVEFFYYSVLSSFITDLIFSYVHHRIKGIFKDKIVFQKRL